MQRDDKGLAQVVPVHTQLAQQRCGLGQPNERDRRARQLSGERGGLQARLAAVQRLALGSRRKTMVSNLAASRGREERICTLGARPILGDGGVCIRCAQRMHERVDRDLQLQRGRERGIGVELGQHIVHLLWPQRRRGAHVAQKGDAPLLAALAVFLEDWVLHIVRVKLQEQLTDRLEQAVACFVHARRQALRQLPQRGGQ
eukprot:6172747-Pleurochrysis_carterae.AAC.11